MVGSAAWTAASGSFLGERRIILSPAYFEFLIKFFQIFTNFYTKFTRLCAGILYFRGDIRDMNYKD